MPPKDSLVLRGAAALGEESGETRRNGIDCGDCGRCGYGCRRGAKQSGIRVHLAEAWRNGARIVPDAPVERVLVEGGRAAGVEASTVVDGVRRRIVVRAPTVVVAAGTLRTPVVLLRSGIDHPAMGRHLRLHPVSIVGAFLDEDVTMWRGTTQAARSLEHLSAGADADGGGFVVESAPGTPGLIGLMFPWDGRAAFRSLMREIRHVAPLLAITADRGGGRVRISRAGRPRIDYTVAPEDRAALQLGLATAARIAWEGGSRRMVALGTPAAWFAAEGGPGDRAAFEAYQARLRDFDFRPNRGTVASAHQMGSARAGAARGLPVRPVGPGANGRRGTGPRRGDRRAVRRRRLAVPDGAGGQPDDHDDGLGAARRADGAVGDGPRLTGPPSGGGRLRVPVAGELDGFRLDRRRGRLDACPRGHDQHDRRDDHDRGDPGPGRQRLLEDDRAEDHRHDRVHVRVGGHARERRHLHQPGERRVPHQAADQQQVQDADPALGRDCRPG